MFLRRMISPFAFPAVKTHSFKNHRQSKEKGRSKCLNKRLKKLRLDMIEISEEQKQIKDGQKQVREKFEAIELECDQLRKETNLVMKQSMNTQIRLAVMFQILRARENQEFDKAAKLTDVLRQLIARENMEKNAETFSDK